MTYHWRSSLGSSSASSVSPPLSPPATASESSATGRVSSSISPITPLTSCAMVRSSAALVTGRSRDSEQKAEELLKDEIHRPAEDPESGRKRDHDSREVDRLLARGPYHLAQLASELTQEIRESLAPLAKREAAPAGRHQRSGHTGASRLPSGDPIAWRRFGRWHGL